jgi:nucleoside diphosphate kinase
MAAVEIQTWKTLEKTYGMIKPDAVRAGAVDAILMRAEKAGFVVIKAGAYTRPLLSPT